MSERKVRPKGWWGGLEEARTHRASSLALVACLMLAALPLSGCGPMWPEGGQERAALHFADATGDAVVISAGPDGKVAFTRKPGGDGFLVSTNFSLANPGNGSYPCWRYARAEELLTVVPVPEISQNSLLQLLAFYGLPLTIGLLLYQAPLLARATRSGYARTVLRRLPAALVSTNLPLAGLLSISSPLIKWHLNYCGFSTLTVLPWWAIAVLGALVGGLLLCVYHTWAIRRGFAAWSTLLWGTGDAGDSTTTVSSPPWRRLRLWILLSFVVLVAGIVLGVMGL